MKCPLDREEETALRKKEERGENARNSKDLPTDTNLTLFKNEALGRGKSAWLSAVIGGEGNALSEKRGVCLSKKKKRRIEQSEKKER